MPRPIPEPTNRVRGRVFTRSFRVSAVVFVFLAVAGCDQPDEAAAPARCSDIVAEAAAESEPPNQVRLLDRALQTCSFQRLTEELERYPTIIGYDPATFVEQRCNRVDDATVSDGRACRSVVAPPETAPPTTVLDLVYVGNTLDGRQIELRPSDTIRFDGDVPAVIQQTVNIAVESGCEAVVSQRDLWAERVDDSDDGDIASVYAQHAQNVADFVQCGAVPLDVDGDTG